MSFASLRKGEAHVIECSEVETVKRDANISTFTLKFICSMRYTLDTLKPRDYRKSGTDEAKDRKNGPEIIEGKLTARSNTGWPFKVQRTKRDCEFVPIALNTVYI